MIKRATLRGELSLCRTKRAILIATYAVSIKIVLFLKKLNQISVIY